jgi:GNAT superfamily N-acetyltransferase
VTSVADVVSVDTSMQRVTLRGPQHTVSLVASDTEQFRRIRRMIDPCDFTCAETLKNGLAVTIRQLRADDRERVAKAVRQLDRESVYTRLFSYRSELTEAGLDRIMRVDRERDVALVVTTRAEGEDLVIATGRYFGSGLDGAEATAEVAFVVEEDYQGLGIASRLLRHLAKIAHVHGMGTLEADMLAENKPMLGVFARSGLPMTKRRNGGTIHVALELRGVPALFG